MLKLQKILINGKSIALDNPRILYKFSSCFVKNSSNLLINTNIIYQTITYLTNRSLKVSVYESVNEHTHLDNSKKNMSPELFLELCIDFGSIIKDVNFSKSFNQILEDKKIEANH
ncbi:hypothetical protein BpHYR1_039992 [Brachionus plicatilis]|uniref:Uncharacterized protein n=1 Tax=Brachionus plicatilis TaxID=10195 RepID=A0A3M7SIF3_BRAPC|nr:hypothetical protein BpHYR1_039992 [Brachionus plicatilis]